MNYRGDNLLLKRRGRRRTPVSFLSLKISFKDFQVFVYFHLYTYNWRFACTSRGQKGCVCSLNRAKCKISVTTQTRRGVRALGSYLPDWHLKWRPSQHPFKDTLKTILQNETAPPGLWLSWSDGDPRTNHGPLLPLSSTLVWIEDGYISGQPWKSLFSPVALFDYCFNCVFISYCIVCCYPSYSHLWGRIGHMFQNK